MTPPNDGQDLSYLWIPVPPADPDVERFEAALAPLRFEPGAHPLRLPRAETRDRGRSRWWAFALTAAATLLLVAGLASWRWQWPAGQAWTVTLEPAGGGPALPRRPDVLEVGQAFATPTQVVARVDVARIGTMRIQPGSELILRSTASNRHRLVITRGTIDLRVWAPPWSVVFTTPAGDVGDLGCEFELVVDEQRTTRVDVRTGWVQLENPWGQSLVPAGASSQMTGDRAPAVPVFDDADETFRSAVQAIERARSFADGAPAVATVLRLARARDVMTLLRLALRTEGASREALVRAAALLAPPPSGVSVAEILNGNEQLLWVWHDALPLPPAKSWWRNWPDALPLWLSGRKAY
jgi:hypothetical protein